MQPGIRHMFPSGSDNGDLYGKQLRVFVKKYLREEQKFAGLDELKQQLAIDRENALAALG